MTAYWEQRSPDDRGSEDPGLDERHIGRVLMFKKGIWPAGFYPLTDARYAAIEHALAAGQRARTKLLPK